MERRPFKTIDEQIEKLEKRGIHFLDKSEDARFLLREGYYTVINGYKDVFIDREATNLAGDDRYPQGLPFEYFKFLYTFDTLLRRNAMSVLLDAESAMKTCAVYAFCDKHRKPDAYLDPSNYCDMATYHDSKNYTRGLIRLLSTMQGIRDNKHHKQYIKHYTQLDSNLPLWVAAKCMTFGNISSFFDFQQQSVKTATCIILSRALNKETVRQNDLTFAFRTLPDFRNICAHNERFYCARTGKNKDKGFSDLMRALSYVVTPERLSEFASSVIELLNEVQKGDSELEEKILEGMATNIDELRTFVL